jgi:hypothetical protein
MGWKPKDKFTGPEGKWVDAKTYVERGEQILPIVQARLKQTERELAEVRKSAQEWQEFNKAAHERAINEWKVKFEQAVKDKAEAINKGDGEAAIEAEARQEELKANRPQPKQETPQVHPSFVAWQERNDWFGQDKAKTRFANGIGLELAKQGLQGDAFFEALDREMSETYVAPTPRAGPQRGGRPSGGGGKGAKSYENLKPEFKEACDKQVRTLKIKPEEYVAACPDDAFRGN